MCDLAESAIQELLLAKLASPEHQAGAKQGDLLRATQAQGACVIHSLGGLRALLRKGHVTPESAAPSEEPETDPNALWRIAGAPASPQEPASVGENGRRRLGNYTYSPSDVLGCGKLGYVVRGRNEFLRRDVAIKFLSPEFTTHADFRRRFEREALILANLNHPNIVKLHDGGQAPEGTFYIAMEYIDGGTLVDLSKKLGRAPASLVARVMYHVASALAAAHRHGILHRDVKLDNVMMTQDGPKLTDFNLSGVDQAAVREVPSALEAVASEVGNPPKLVGTLPYMSPERINGERGDLRSDIYSLGATFYTFACGGRLFEGVPVDDYMGWRWHHNKETPQALIDRVPGFSPALAAIIHRCLARDPDERYPRYEELLQNLTAVIKDLPAPPGTESWSMEPPWDAAGNNRRPFPMRPVAAALVLAALVAFLIINPFRKPSQPSASPPHTSKLKAEVNRIADFADSDQPKPIAGLEQPERNADSQSPVGNAELRPIPALPDPLEKRLATYQPSPSEIAALGEILDLVSGHRKELLARLYDPLLAEIDTLERRLRIGPRGESDQDYVLRHLGVARDLVKNARATVQVRLKSILTANAPLTLKLEDGSSVSGTVAEKNENVLAVKDEVGQEVALPMSSISHEEFLGGDSSSPGRLAFQGLTADPIRALEEVLHVREAAPEFLLTIPLLVRLGRLEAEDRIQIALRLLTKSGAKQDQASRALTSFTEKSSEVLSLYRSLEPEFAKAKRELEAFRALVESRASHVLAAYGGTHAYPAAANLVLHRFERDLESTGAEDLMAGTGFIDFGWRLSPTESDEKKRRAYIRRDPVQDAVILADPDGPRHFLMEDGITQTATGVLVRYRFEPLGGAPQSSEWRFPLLGEGGRGTYLRLRGNSIGLYSPKFASDVPDEELARSLLPPPQQGEIYRSLTLVPGESGFLHVFLDGAVVFNLPLKNATIPRALCFTVRRGSLTLKNVTVRSSASATENRK